MKLLSIDSATGICSASLYIDGKTDERFNITGSKSSSLLLPMCERLLRANHIKLTDLDGIIYSKGPGTFTGVRMAVGVAQGLVLASGIKSMGVNVLEAMAYYAYQKLGHQKTAVALDARMDEVYWQHFDFLSAAYAKPSLLKPQDVPFLGNEFIGVGSGWQSYENALCKQSGVMQFEYFDMHASMLIDVVRMHVKEEFSSDIRSIKPLYLRNRVAEKSVK